MITSQQPQHSLAARNALSDTFPSMCTPPPPHGPSPTRPSPDRSAPCRAAAYLPMLALHNPTKLASA
jgi:hypothetical protein